jgi:hypothetical protein
MPKRSKLSVLLQLNNTGKSGGLQHLGLTTNIRLGWNWLAIMNAIAYSLSILTASIRNSIVQGLFSKHSIFLTYEWVQ